MKLKRLLGKLDEYLNDDKRRSSDEAKALKKVLNKLKDKQRQLQAEAQHEDDPARATVLEDRAKVVHAQRRKGLAALKELKKKKA